LPIQSGLAAVPFPIASKISFRLVIRSAAHAVLAVAHVTGLIGGAVIVVTVVPVVIRLVAMFFPPVCIFCGRVYPLACAYPSQSSGHCTGCEAHGSTNRAPHGGSNGRTSCPPSSRAYACSDRVSAWRSGNWITVCVTIAVVRL